MVRIPSHGGANSGLCIRRYSNDPRSVCVLSPCFISTNHCPLTVHALYNRGKHITILLIVLLLAQVLTMVFCAIFTVAKFDFNPVCLPVDTPRSYLPLAYVATTFSAPQLTLIHYVCQHPMFAHPSYPARPRPLPLLQHHSSCKDQIIPSHDDVQGRSPGFLYNRGLVFDHSYDVCTVR
jgi:hypothetical protein